MKRDDRLRCSSDDRHQALVLARRASRAGTAAANGRGDNKRTPLPRSSRDAATTLWPICPVSPTWTLFSTPLTAGTCLAKSVYP